MSECNKVDHRIECIKCGYPMCEAAFPDQFDELECSCSDEEAKAHIEKYRAHIDKAIEILLNE